MVAAAAPPHPAAVAAALPLPAQRGGSTIISLRVSCRAASPRCSRQVQCDCVACIEGASTALSVDYTRLILRLKGGGEYVFGHSSLEVERVRLEQLPWHLAELVVDTCKLYEEGSVYAEFPPSNFTKPTRRTAGHRFSSETLRLGFANRRSPNPKEDAELMQGVRAEADRKARLRHNWWKGPALAFVLGTHERIGERSPIRMLDSDALRGILAAVHAAGPASEADFYANDPGRPTYTLVWGYPELQASKSPPALPRLPSESGYDGYWYVTSSVLAESSMRMRLAGAARDHRRLATRSCS